MDDIIESVGDRESAESITLNIEKLVDVGGFKIKGWTISGSFDSRKEKDIPSETRVPQRNTWEFVGDPLRTCFASR